MSRSNRTTNGLAYGNVYVLKYGLLYLLLEIFMASIFAHQWSTALGLNVSAVNADQAGLQRLSQGMADFLQMRHASSVMDKINSELNVLQHFGEDIRLKLDYGDGMIVNDETKQLADAFLIEARDAVQGKWPQAWGEGLKEPLMLFVAYATASNATSEVKIDWAKTLPMFIMAYVKEKGADKLREHTNSIDQLLPQVLIGAGMALLSLEGIEVLNEKVKQFAAKQVPNSKPQPVAFMDILLEVHNAHRIAGIPAQAQT